MPERGLEIHEVLEFGHKYYKVNNVEYFTDTQRFHKGATGPTE